MIVKEVSVESVTVPGDPDYDVITTRELLNYDSIGNINKLFVYNVF